MKICNNCSAINGDGVNACSDCGYDLVNNPVLPKKENADVQVQVIQKKVSGFCAKCGMKNEDSASFCVNCGDKLSGGSSTSQKETNVNVNADASGIRLMMKDPNKAFIIITAGVFVVLILFFGKNLYNEGGSGGILGLLIVALIIGGRASRISSFFNKNK